MAWRRIAALPYLGVLPSDMRHGGCLNPAGSGYHGTVAPCLSKFKSNVAVGAFNDHSRAGIHVLVLKKVP